MWTSILASGSPNFIEGAGTHALGLYNRLQSMKIHICIWGFSEVQYQGRGCSRLSSRAGELHFVP